MIYLRTYITESFICPGNKKQMKYDVVRIIIQAPKIEKIFIFIEKFQENNIAPKCCSNMLHVSQGTILLGKFQSFNKITNQESPDKSQKSIK